MKIERTLTTLPAGDLLAAPTTTTQTLYRICRNCDECGFCDSHPALAYQIHNLITDAIGLEVIGPQETPK